MITRGKSVAARSWSCSKPSHTGLTTRLRPTCDRNMLQSWANLRKNVRLVAEVVILVAEVVDDRKGQISRNKVDGHVQNWSCHLTTGGTTNRLLTQNSTTDRTIDRLWLPLVVRLVGRTFAKSQPIVRSSNRTIRCYCGFSYGEH